MTQLVAYLAFDGSGAQMADNLLTLIGHLFLVVVAVLGLILLLKRSLMLALGTFALAAIAGTFVFSGDSVKAVGIGLFHFLFGV